ncbi:MAG: hypothetical protein ACYTDU_11935 [Planctomycetota bacterium]|jgi:nitrite reductase/ring-hydroxylating ferredoxin subunit
MDDSYSPERRRLLRRLGAAVAAFFTVLFGIPAGATVLDPVLRRGAAGWAAAGAADAVQDGVAKRFTYEVRAGWETRKQVGFLVREGETILALFSLDGRPLEGPPEAPLARLETKVENGQVKVKA